MRQATIGDITVTVFHRDGKIIASYMGRGRVDHVVIETDSIACLVPGALDKALQTAKERVR